MYITGRFNAESLSKSLLSSVQSTSYHAGVLHKLSSLTIFNRFRRWGQVLEFPVSHVEASALPLPVPHVAHTELHYLRAPGHMQFP